MDFNKGIASGSGLVDRPLARQGWRLISTIPSSFRTPIRPSISTRVATQSGPSIAVSSLNSPSNRPQEKKVLVPIGMGTEEMEAVILANVLRRAGAEVTLASVEKELEVSCSSGVRLVADACISKCADQMFDLVALPVSFYVNSCIEWHMLTYLSGRTGLKYKI